MCSVSEVKKIEVHTAEPLAHGTSPFEVEINVVNLKKHKSPGSDKIPTEPIQAGDIHKHIHFIWNKKEELPDQWK
jgi:hypothetical protein